MTIIPSAGGNFGPLKYWCWVTAENNGTAADLQWAYYYSEVFVGCFILTIITVIPLRKWADIQVDIHKRKLAIRMIFFTIVWIILKLPAMVDRGYQLFWPGNTLPALTFVHAITIPSMGLADAVVYAATSVRMQEFFTSLKFRIITNQGLRRMLINRHSNRQKSSRLSRFVFNSQLSCDAAQMDDTKKGITAKAVVIANSSCDSVSTHIVDVQESIDHGNSFSNAHRQLNKSMHCETSTNIPLQQNQEAWISNNNIGNHQEKTDTHEYNTKNNQKSSHIKRLTIKKNDNNADGSFVDKMLEGLILPRDKVHMQEMIGHGSGGTKHCTIPFA